MIDGLKEKDSNRATNENSVKTEIIENGSFITCLPVLLHRPAEFKAIAENLVVILVRADVHAGVGPARKTHATFIVLVGTGIGAGAIGRAAAADRQCGHAGGSTWCAPLLAAAIVGQNLE